MKRQPYLGQNEYVDFLKVGVLAGEAENIANRTPEKDWRQKLRTISTLCKRIVDERLACMGKKELLKIQRRTKNNELLYKSSDTMRMHEDDLNKPETHVVVVTDDLYDLVDLSMLNCFCCAQGECVEDCHWRSLYHKFGIPVARPDPKEGECEFSLQDVGFTKCVNPQYRQIEPSERLVKDRI